MPDCWDGGRRCKGTKEGCQGGAKSERQNGKENSTLSSNRGGEPLYAFFPSGALPYSNILEQTTEDFLECV